jgi:hypothetical protein
MGFKINKSNLFWYFILLVCVIGLFFIYKYQIGIDVNLKENGIKTTGYCTVKQTDPLAYKQKQLVSWVYNIDGKKYYRKKTKSTPIELQNYEYYTIYYKADDKEKIFIDYTDFILKGRYLNTESILVDKDMFNKKRVSFKYVVNDVEYERYQRLKVEPTSKFAKNYLVKYNVDNPKIGYLYLDSIR